ncbi:MAG: RHS repeat protein [Bacillota bacterium]
MIEANPKSYRKTPVDTFGYGWSLNIPWIEQTDKGKFIRLPGGQTIKIELDSNQRFEYHAGAHFIMEGTSTLTLNDGTKYAFDDAGRVLGNKTAVTDPRGDGTDGSFTTWYVYDDLNRLTKTILPDNTPGDKSDNPYTETTYDAIGNKLTERDPNGDIFPEKRPTKFEEKITVCEFKIPQKVNTILKQCENRFPKEGFCFNSWGVMSLYR